MSKSLELFLRRLRDPRWIPHISSYCDGRCARCAFTERCWSYALQRHEAGEAHEESSAVEPDRDSASEDASPRIQAWAERHGIDLNDLTPDAGDDKAYERLQERIDNDALGIRAKDYGTDVWKIVEPLVPHQSGGAFAGAETGSELSNALDDLWGLALTIRAKVHRAISSFEHNKEEDIESDPVQTDANGSAKVALLAVAQSLAAWEIVSGARAVDSLAVEYFVENLKQLETELIGRFPHAMGFVRPGFDEEIPGIVRPWSIMPGEEFEDEDDQEEEGAEGGW